LGQKTGRVPQEGADLVEYRILTRMMRFTSAVVSQARADSADEAPSGANAA
jgi:hypothetical protein